MATFPYFSFKRLLILLVSIVLSMVMTISLSALWVLPHVDRYRPQLEHLLSAQTGYQIKIAKIAGNWSGIAPQFTLDQVTLSDQEHQVIVKQIVLIPSWKSLIAFEPVFANIKVNLPHLTIYRDKQSDLWINQLPIHMIGQHRLANWLLGQKNIELRNASIKWQDDFQKTEPIWLYETVATYTHTPIAQLFSLTTAKINKIGRQIALEAVWRGKDVAYWKRWSGLLSASAKHLRVGSWVSAITKNNIIQDGSGSLWVTLNIKQNKLKNIHAAFNINSIALKLSSTAMPITLKKTLGHLSFFCQTDQSYQVFGKFSQLSADGLFSLQNSQLRIHVSPQNKIKEAQLRIGRATIFSLNQLKYLPNIGLAPAVKNIAAKGYIANALLAWRNISTRTPTFLIEADFAKFSGWLNHQQAQVRNISGHIFVTQHQGKLVLDSQNSQLILPTIFTDPLRFTQLSSKIRWQQPNQTHIQLERLFIVNQDFRANLAGQYDYPHKANLVLSGTFDQVKAQSITHYLPKKMRLSFRKWFSQALKSGTVNKAKFLIKGNPLYFPFVNGKGGEFKAEAIGQNIRFNFHPDWPIMDNIDGKLSFRNASLQIQAKRARIANIELKPVKIAIPNVTYQPTLFASGRGDATLENYLRFVEKIPHQPRLTQFIEHLHGKGKALLDLSLQIPIPKNVRHKASFLAHVALKNNAIYFTNLPIPPAEDIKGDLYINKQGIQAKNIALAALGGKWQLMAQANPQKTQLVTIRGQANNQALAKQYIDFLSPYIKGKSPYQIVARIQNGLKNITIHSSLNGAALSLPKPLEKKAASDWPLALTLHSNQPNGWLIDYMLPTQKISGGVAIDKKGYIHQSLLQLGTLKTSLLNEGFSLFIDTKKIMIDPWLNMIGHWAGKKNIQKPVAIHIKANQLVLLDAVLNNLRFKALHNGHHGWTGELTSAELSTKFSVQQKPNALYARLTKFNLNNLDVFKKLLTSPDQKYRPTLGVTSAHIHIDNFYHGGRNLGQLDLSAQQKKYWQIKTIKLINLNGVLSAQLTPSNNNTNSKLMLETNNIGKLLARLGYPHMIEGGYGALRGSLSWSNNMTLLNKQDITGSVTLNLYRGRITKVNPGISNFFNLLSLQSILRFVRLDFSNFASGFAFDRFKGTIVLKEGTLQSNQLMISGPTADIAINGLLDFKHNLLDLHVRIAPHILDSVALATGMIALNPWAGIATLFSQQALKNPLEKILAIEYEICGSIDHPIIKRK